MPAISDTSKIPTAILLLLRAGYHLKEEAFGFLDLISKTVDPMEFVRATCNQLKSHKEKPRFLSKQLLEDVANKGFPGLGLSVVIWKNIL